MARYERIGYQSQLPGSGERSTTDALGSELKCFQISAIGAMSRYRMRTKDSGRSIPNLTVIEVLNTVVN